MAVTIEEMVDRVAVEGRGSGRTLTSDQVRELASAWAVATCLSQGLAVELASGSEILKIVALVRLHDRLNLDAPERTKSARIKVIHPDSRPFDVDGLEHSSDDGSAFVQTEIWPAAS